MDSAPEERLPWNKSGDGITERTRVVNGNHWVNELP